MLKSKVVEPSLEALKVTVPDSWLEPAIQLAFPFSVTECTDAS